jgi:hypothetical protein
MFGHCRVCDEKDKRIADLKETIADLKLQLNPPPRPIPTYEMETDFTLDGAGREALTPNSVKEENQITETERLNREQDAIFSGNF